MRHAKKTRDQFAHGYVLHRTARQATLISRIHSWNDSFTLERGDKVHKCYSLLIAAVLVLHAACVTKKIEDRVYNALSLCNAGSNAKMSASLQAKIGKNIHEGVSFNAGVEDEIKGMLLSSPGVTAATIETVQKQYNECVNRYLSKS